MAHINPDLLKSLTSVKISEAFVDDSEDHIFYFANMCHVCHCFGEKVNMRRCSACNMISYCNADHQKKDWSSHRDFCRAMCQVKKDWKLDYIFQSLKCTNNEPNKSISTIVNEARSRVEFKGRLRSKATQILKRTVKYHELQMIHFPRVCAVCFECQPKLLKNCKKCPQTSFCDEHLNDPSHQEVCPKMLAVFSLEVKKTDMAVIVGVAQKLKVPYQAKAVKLPSCMINFLDSYLPESPKIKSSMADDAEMTFALLSEKFSRPLSLLFAIEKLDFTSKSKMTVHVIGANMQELIINDWEVILHWLPKMSEFKLVLIGPDILLNFDNTHNVCKHCQKNKKKLIIEMKQSVYEEYFYKGNFQKPDIIAGFQSGLYAYPSWNEAMKIFGRLNCPLLITAQNQIEGYREQEKISSNFHSAKCLLFQLNPFSSLLYTRCHVHEGVYSRNEFMLLYKDLGTSNS